ncbi:MAG TPA: alpha/beta hydrolase, partial [Caulobacter sp.]|nr:alpha/beta hydrolase [Caulobacter sp.]
RFRTNGDDGLMGESLAALFVVDTFLNHGADFDRYVAISPSLWWDRGQLAARAQSLLEKGTQPPRTIWLSMADEGGAMQGAMDQLVSALDRSGRAEIVWSYTPYPQESHGTIYHPAAVRAVRQLYPPPKPPG